MPFTTAIWFSGATSATNWVPDAVPSLRQSCRTPLTVAPKYISSSLTATPSTTATSVSNEPPGCDPSAPGLTSSTSTVPPGVPSVFHSSLPLAPSLALSSSVPLTGPRITKWNAVKSRTLVVPAAVPSLTSSVWNCSRPCTSRNNFPLATTSCVTPTRCPATVRMSFTSCVPASVPSVRQSCGSVRLF